MIRSMADVEDEGEDKAESEAVVKEEAVVKVEDEEGDEEKAVNGDERGGEPGPTDRRAYPWSPKNNISVPRAVGRANRR